MSNQLLDTKPKLSVKAKNICEDIVWGSRLYVNAQLLFHLLSLLVIYNQGECTLSDLFSFVHAVHKQKKVKLYKELSVQFEELITLEELLKTGKVDKEDTSVIRFTINSMYLHFTGRELYRNYEK